MWQVASEISVINCLATLRTLCYLEFPQAYLMCYLYFSTVLYLPMWRLNGVYSEIAFQWTENSKHSAAVAHVYFQFRCAARDHRVISLREHVSQSLPFLPEALLLSIGSIARKVAVTENLCFSALHP